MNATATYSEPKITRDSTSAVIEYDMTIDGIPSWDAIQVHREDSGFLISDRTSRAALSSNVAVPDAILPSFIAELQRLAEVAR